MDKALKLSCQDHVHEEETGEERDQEIRIRLSHHLGAAQKLVAIIDREVHGVHKCTEFSDGIAQGLVAFQVRRDDDLPHHAEPVDCRRTLRRLERGQARQLYESCIRGRNHQPPDGIRSIAERQFST